MAFEERLAYTCPNKVLRFREGLQKDVDSTVGGIIQFKHYHKYSVGLPPLSTFPLEFQQLYKDAVIDQDMKDDLERANIINWCRSAKTLYPLKTTGDGNCLLHAVALYLWGVEDTDLFLRRLLYINLSTDPGGKLHTRWLANQKYTSELHRFDVRLNTAEWDTIIRATEDAAVSGNQALEYSTLESIHLYVLANILKRPIIVLADSLARNVYGQTLQENHIGGIYLPLEQSPVHCLKDPILIGYNMNHFAPLLCEEDIATNHVNVQEQVMPFVTKDMNSLMIRYLLPNEERNCTRFLQDYLKMEEVVHSGDSNIVPVPVAKIEHKSLPEDLNVMLAHRQDCEKKFRRLMDTEVGIVSRNTPPAQPVVPQFDFKIGERLEKLPLNIPENTDVRTGHNARVLMGMDKTMKAAQPRTVGADEQHLKCITMGCNMYGNPQTARMCSKCFNDFTVQFARQEQAAKRVKQPYAAPNVAGTQQGAPMQRERAEQAGLEDLSIMIDEDCRAGCGFKCSKETYPFCHECVQRQFQFAAPPPAAAGRNQQPSYSMLPDKCQVEHCQYQCSKATHPFCHECFEKARQAAMKAPTAPPPSFPQYTSTNAVGPVTPQAEAGPDLQLHIVRNDETSVVIVPSAVPRQGLNRGENNQSSILPGQVGELPKKCQKPNCPNNAIKGNNGLCDSCYNKAVFGGNNTRYGSIVGSITETAHHSSRIPARCITEKCAERALDNSLHCIKCTTSRGLVPSGAVQSGMELNIHPVSPSDEKILNSDPGAEILSRITGARSMSQPQQHDENVEPVATPIAVQLQEEQQARYQDLPHRKYICSSPGCEGVRLDNSEGLCYSCMHKNDTEVSCTPVHLSEKEMKEINPVVVSSRQKVKCASRVCDTLIYPPKKLCDECNIILESQKAEASKKKNEESASASSKKCKSEGCQFFGSSAHDGYCSSCYLGRVNLRHTAPLATSKSNDKEKRHHTAPLGGRKTVGKPCIELNCQRYGDPSQLDRCSQHFQQSQERLPPSGSHGNMSPVIEDVTGAVGPSSNDLSGGTAGHGRNVPLKHNVGNISIATSRSGAPVDPYIAAMSKVEMSRKSTDLCKNYAVTGCQNFGSASKKGYCNACYPQMQRQGNFGKKILSGQNQFG